MMAAQRADASPFPLSQSWVLDNLLTRAMASRFVGRLDLKPGMRVLDFGCGPGRLTLPLARAVGAGGEVLAVDLQAEMLARVERRAASAGVSSIRTLRASAGEADLPARSFDLALLAYVLGEIPPDQRPAAFTQIATALRGGGRLVVAEAAIDPHRQSPDAVRSLGEAAGLQIDTVKHGPLSSMITLRSGSKTE
jgi:ubiquinone/menaquinone biosynthesis C-methylase UbiE